MGSSGLLLLLLYVAACTAAPRQMRSTDSGSNSEEVNQFDLGPVDTCNRPSTNFCENVDYAVPTSIANLTIIFEKEIQADYVAVMQQESQECATAVRDISCAMRFPRCSDDHQTVTLGAANCTAILSVCSSEVKGLLAGICNLSGTYPLGSSENVDTACKPVTSYSNYSFENCPVNSDWFVTQWMYELVVYADTFGFAQRSFLKTYEECWPNYAKYTCQLNGRCWNSSDGTTRVEAINSYTSCEDGINCFPDWAADYIRERQECSLWPRKDMFIPTEPCTTASPETTEEPSSGTTATPIQTDTTDASEPTWPTTSPTPGHTFSNARIVLSSAVLLCVSLLLILALLV